MGNKNIIIKYLKENNYNIKPENSKGIIINNNKKEILIKGSKLDLIELADYIISVALSKKENDHIHIDNLTLINENSEIKELIIEKY